MKQNIAIFSLVVAACIVMPAITRAQYTLATNAPAAPTPNPHKQLLTFHGKVTSVDFTAMTLTVGTETYNITQKTRFFDKGNSATFADVIAGETIGGSYEKDDEKMNATMVTIEVKDNFEK